MAAFSNYTELKATLADWLNRDDLTAVIPSFISLAEAQFNKDERFRNQMSIVRAQADFDSQYEALPSDYLEMLNLTLVGTDGQSKKMGFLTLNQMDEYRAAFNTNGFPKYYSIVGKQLELLPVPGDTYSAEMVYYGRIPALSSTNATNWLLTYHPDAYLYGALLQSAPYLKDDDRVATWGTLYEGIANNIHEADDRALFAGAVIKARAKPF